MASIFDTNESKQVIEDYTNLEELHAKAEYWENMANEQYKAFLNARKELAEVQDRAIKDLKDFNSYASQLNRYIEWHSRMLHNWNKNPLLYAFKVLTKGPDFIFDDLKECNIEQRVKENQEERIGKYYL